MCPEYIAHASFKCSKILVKVLFSYLPLCLHRDYAVAKECVTKEAKTGCAIGQYINTDLFNPFCTYNTDPPLNSSSMNEFIQYVLRFF